MSRIVSADRLNCIESNVWVEFIELANKYKPRVNLGQGFPDFPAPEHICRALASTVVNPDRPLINQYTRDCGHPRLTTVLSQLYGQLVGRPIDADSEILITSGAYQSLFNTFMAYVNPGDEVIIIEPYFDCYEPMTRLAGGIPVFVPLRPRRQSPPVDGDEDSRSPLSSSSADWILDPEELESKFSDKTKFIVVNTPNNPLGKVYTREELELIGRLCQKYDCLVVMDEVYEWLIYPGSPQRQHTRMASLPGMWDRTLTIGSAGKTFSVTGWKIGWTYGPRDLIRPLYLIHQSNVSSCATPIQEALAIGFELELKRLDTDQSYWRQLTESLVGKRDKLSAVLSTNRLMPTVPDGGYFMVADCSQLLATEKVDITGESGPTRGWRFARWLSKHRGLQVIPVSAFYSREHNCLAENLIRFCFCKTDRSLETAEQIIRELIG
ncbi:kynurenine aminotransferase-like [Oppia nitens]|uniref:kynurenine aminotransferase-like n=1 Tax=Oppia nitens TaxID=1686743 RepID=UPI0023DAA2C8|nr:kynurenine aminotransferase-like [Oppia nitens]